MNLIASLLILLAILISASLVLSTFLTHRHPLTNPRSPSEVGLDFEEITFPAADGLVLRGWWVPCPGAERVIIQLHGQGGSMDPDIQYLPAWHAAGFNVLMFDFRAHGRSPGNFSTVGYLERQDVQGAVQFVLSKGIQRIGLLGFSMGGIVSMLSTPICPEVMAIVSDGGPARLRTALREWCVERHIPRPLGVFLAWLVLCGVAMRLGVNIFRYEPVLWVGQIAPRPILFIHGEHDQYCPDFDELWAAARPIKEAWRVSEAGHTTASQQFPEEYRRRVIEFFDKYL
jgi:pimeloyl-ACP methyl ester carboxylesterase